MKFVYYPLTRVPIGVNNLRRFHSEGVYLLDTIITKYTAAVSKPTAKDKNRSRNIPYKPFGRFMRVIGWKHAPSAALSC